MTEIWACAKCGTELHLLPRVIGAWPEVYCCPNPKCEIGGMLMIRPGEIE